jgi:hypothetical protein
LAVASQHLAPVPGGSSEAPTGPIPSDIDSYASLDCETVRSNGTRSAFEVGLQATPDEFGASFTGLVDATLATTSCRFRVADPVFGSFEITETLAAGTTTRFLMVGDGINEPTRVLVLGQSGAAFANPQLSPQPFAVARSVDLWYDVSRPAQGITLYELPGSDDVLGTWFSHDANGNPVGFYFDGIADIIPGQREMVVLKPSRGAEGLELEPVGTARLFYLDCNLAELRVLLGQNEFRTRRIRRSVEVGSCDAFN